jgi:hypothetical protein
MSGGGGTVLRHALFTPGVCFPFILHATGALAASLIPVTYNGKLQGIRCVAAFLYANYFGKNNLFVMN